MKRFLTTVLTVILTIVLLAGAAAGFILYRKYKPSKEQVDQNEWYQASGDEMALFLDSVLVEGVKGRYIDGQTYLQLDWIDEAVNEKFYWDEENRQLIYTLPDQIVYANEETMGSSGKPLVVQQDGQVWLLSSLVTAYTNVRIDTYDTDNVRRVFVDTSWEPQQLAAVKKKSALRIRGGVKSAMITEVPSDSEVIVLEQLDNWSRVRTEDGQVGYLANRRLKETESRTLVSTFTEPEYTSISMDGPVVLVWHQVTNRQANQAMENLVSNTKGVNVIAPTWFMLTDNQGNYESLADKNYVDRAHSMGLQVWAVLDNFNKGENVQSEILFASMAARKKLIASLMQDAKTYGFDGINLDVEGIKASAGPHYVQFIRELSIDCRKEGLVLSIDSYVPASYSAFYNWAEQGRVADYVVMMGYDEHYAGGEAGSVASIGYERQGIEDLLKQVPKEKLISAIPFYTRIWKEDASGTTSQSLGIADAKAWVEDNQVELYWQDDLGQYYGETQKDGVNYEIWMEEERSLALKMQLIRDNGLAGVACWRLGLEPADIWDTVKLP
ncbi:glycosyl hydrolase family 18 protein [Clostridium sp. AM42-4]|jgi:spore germination protein YaaH|uniref:glycosyl hydrolase family 18 protein n=1 Tax=Clostridium sp. AM42-4 TaxID=2292305 RepID=UPI000E50A35F|nr:glycosyl hydrolase family 18 protein [Clostridium sp. AM42-4]RHS84171.1 glycoside hydrolase [Clostridium sp. AM42-4]